MRDMTTEAAMIEAEEYHGGEHGRAGTMKGAVREFLSNMMAGTTRPVAGLVDADGNDRGIHFRSLVSQYGKETGRAYTTRDMKDGNLCHVWRIK